MYLNTKKYQFKVKRVKYLSLILTTKEVEIDSKKVAIILEQLLSRNVKDV